jgi:acyl carrier protein
MSDTEQIVRRQVARVARTAGASAEQLDLDSPLRQDYAVSSMKMVMLMTALCKELGVSLETFDERQVAGIRTARDLIRVFDEVRGEAAA